MASVDLGAHKVELSFKNPFYIDEFGNKYTRTSNGIGAQRALCQNCQKLIGPEYWFTTTLNGVRRYYHLECVSIAASNPVTTQSPSLRLRQVADKLEVDIALSELTVEYNLSLVDDEPVMTEAEMAEIMEVSGVAEREECKTCEFEGYGKVFSSICRECFEEKAREAAEQEKHNFSKWWAELRKALGGVEKVEYLTAKEYYLAKRGEL